MLIFLYKEQKKIGDIRWVTSWRGSVAGVTGVPTAPRVVEAPLGAAMLAAARATSRAATGAAADESGNEAGLTAVTPVASGAVVSPGTAVVGSGTRVAGVDRGGGGLTARPLPLVGGGCRLSDGDTEEVVQQVEGHPGVGGPGAVYRPPPRVGGDDVGVAGVPLPCNQVAGRDNGAVGEGTEALLEEGVEPPQILQ